MHQYKVNATQCSTYVENLFALGGNFLPNKGTTLMQGNLNIMFLYVNMCFDDVSMHSIVYESRVSSHR